MGQLNSQLVQPPTTVGRNNGTEASARAETKSTRFLPMLFAAKKVELFDLADLSPAGGVLDVRERGAGDRPRPRLPCDLE
jgi:hypothetical protein